MPYRFRCVKCNHEFVSEKQACAKCGLDAVANPKAAVFLHRLRVIHYDPPHPDTPAIHQNVRACDPSKRIGTGGMATGEARNVNCEACMATQAYKDAVAAGALRTSLLDSEDEIIGVSIKGAITATKKDDCGCGE